MAKLTTKTADYTRETGKESIHITLRRVRVL